MGGGLLKLESIFNIFQTVSRDNKLTHNTNVWFKFGQNMLNAVTDAGCGHYSQTETNGRFIKTTLWVEETLK